MQSENVILACSGRFHHFHLARQLEKQGRLKYIISGYPRFELKDEGGIPNSKIKTSPFWKLLPIALSKMGIRSEQLSRYCSFRLHYSVALLAAKQVSKGDVVIGLSSSGLEAGVKAKDMGGRYICDRASSHIVFQDRILREEYARWGLKWKGVDPKIIAREEAEYAAADFITIPSDFTKQSFLKEGVPEHKIKQVPYGARLDRFQIVSEPDPNHFTVLWVGAVSVRKAFLDALHAFQKLNHPSKRMRVIGHVEDAIADILKEEDLKDLELIGAVPNTELSRYYSESDVFILSSVEEGLAMVQGEAMACGCPVIASVNTGGRDLFENGVSGFEVPIRDPSGLCVALQNLSDMSIEERKAIRSAARERVEILGGWDTYGSQWSLLLNV